MNPYTANPKDIDPANPLVKNIYFSGIREALDSVAHYWADNIYREIRDTYAHEDKRPTPDAFYIELEGGGLQIVMAPRHFGKDLDDLDDPVVARRIYR